MRRRERRKERKEREERRKRRRKGRAKWRGEFFSSPSSFPSALQVIAREKSQRKPRTSKFFMVGKLDFYVFHA